MEGILKTDKHFVTFSFDSLIKEWTYHNFFIGPKYAEDRGYVWLIAFEDSVSYLIDIMPMDEARYMYE